MAETKTRTVTINEDELVSLAQAALLVGIAPQTFVSRAGGLGIDCVSMGRDGRGTMRSYRLGDVLEHRQELSGGAGLHVVRDQRDRCILMLYRTVAKSYAKVAEIVGGISRSQIHNIVQAQIRDEARRQAAVEESVMSDE